MEIKKKVDDAWKKKAKEEKKKLEEDELAVQAARKALLKADFPTFISGLASQVLIHLGEMQNPITQKTEADLDQAKYTIDLLALLEEKTKGNLTAQEAQLLQSLLYDLRMRFVKASS